MPVFVQKIAVIGHVYCSQRMSISSRAYRKASNFTDSPVQLQIFVNKYGARNSFCECGRDCYDMLTEAWCIGLPATPCTACRKGKVCQKLERGSYIVEVVLHPTRLMQLDFNCNMHCSPGYESRAASESPCSSSSELESKTPEESWFNNIIRITSKKSTGIL